MSLKSILLILTALLLQSVADGREEKHYNGGHLKHNRLQQRASVGEARFTSDIFNKLAALGKFSSTTPVPTETSYSYTMDPSYPSRTSTSETYGSHIGPGTATSHTYGTHPHLITSDTSASDVGDGPYDATSSSRPNGADAITSVALPEGGGKHKSRRKPRKPHKPQQPQEPEEEEEQQPQIENQPPVDEVKDPDSNLALTSGVANDDDDDADGGDFLRNNYDERDSYSNDVDDNVVLYKKYYLNHIDRYENLNDFNGHVQVGRASQTRPYNRRRNQLRRRRLQPVNRIRVRTGTNNRRRPQTVISPVRRTSTHRRRYNRRRNTRRQAQLNDNLKRRRLIRSRRNRNNSLNSRRRVPASRIIIRQV